MVLAWIQVVSYGLFGRRITFDKFMRNTLLRVLSQTHFTA